MDGSGTSMLVARTLERVGTDAQRAEVVPRIHSGEILVCLGYSEPDSGSDVAAAKTRARRDGDEWVISGQKMFTTLAHESAYVFLLTRTNTDVPKHRGLTMFLVPMGSAGIEVRAMYSLGGERTNVTFYNDVRVPDAARVGEVDGGWDVMAVALAFERQPAANGETRRLFERALALARESGAIDEPVVRDRLHRVAIDVEVGRLLGERLWSRGDSASCRSSRARWPSSSRRRRSSGPHPTCSTCSAPKACCNTARPVPRPRAGSSTPIATPPS